MNFDLSGEQEQIRDSVGRFGAAANRRALRSLPGGYSLERWREMAELGLLALAVPEAAGGMGGSPIDLAIVAEALGNAIAPDPWLENGVLPARLLCAAGRHDLIESAQSGETFFAFAFAERARRFSLEPRAVVIEAAPGGDELRGEKTFVSGGALADRLLCWPTAGGRRRSSRFPPPAQASSITPIAWPMAASPTKCASTGFRLRAMPILP